jgi:biopolymer transport protein ExbD
MRRFSQRSGLVTLSEINITPLLDLAFVLLIIFVITTPLLERSMPLKLPTGNTPSAQVNPRDIRTIEISPRGEYRYNKMPMPLNQIEQYLIRDFSANPNLIVAVRADKAATVDQFYAVVERCLRNNINRIDLKTVPPRRP